MKSTGDILTKFGMEDYRVHRLLVFILYLPNLVRMFIGLIACMGLLLVKKAQ